MDVIEILAKELNLNPARVKSAVELIDAGNTIPFIARYRKEVTGSLDDQVLRELDERLTYLRGLEKKKEEVIAHITQLEQLTSELEQSIRNAKTLAELDDLYRPYRPKRRTRATVAMEKGLEPLAKRILAQRETAEELERAALEFVSEEREVLDAAQAIDGACDIVAEQISDNAVIRGLLRELMRREAVVVSKGKPETESVYTQYYDFTEPASKIAGHRILAVDRGEREKFLKVSVELEEERALRFIRGEIIEKDCRCPALMERCVTDSYDRLIFPALERELRSSLTEQAAAQAIKVFGLNVRHLLMQPPVKGAVTLGLDPAYRTGCKLAVVDATGKVLETGVVYPTPPHNKTEEAKKTVSGLIVKYGVSVIAIGNGTASRESEQFVADLLRELPVKAAYMIVSEAGASVYSASKLAAEEFPEYDVSLRSAVSIARRLQDPLAELVKIDPKAIGVGQYQHDMPKAEMDHTLTGVVEDCVNAVGVDLNTASHSLLSYVAGVNSGVAKNIVAYREENGAFDSRGQLLKVPKLGKKAYEQCAGFLRVPGGKNVLDATGVHPESYAAAEQLLEICRYTKEDVKAGKLSDLQMRAEQIGLSRLSEIIGVGVPTLSDIIKELAKPGRDPRDELPPPLLRSDVLEMADLRPEMVLSGTVRNVIDFGAFVDIGVHEDGLVHISQLCDRFVRHPSEVVKVGDVVKVKVLTVDPAKKRIGLTMKGLN